jgi:hypothetical protein
VDQVQQILLLRTANLSFLGLFVVLFALSLQLRTLFYDELLHLFNKRYYVACVMLGRIVLGGAERLGEDLVGFETLQKMYKSLEILIKTFPVSVFLKRYGGVEVCLHVFFN